MNIFQKHIYTTINAKSFNTNDILTNTTLRRCIFVQVLGLKSKKYQACSYSEKDLLILFHMYICTYAHTQYAVTFLYHMFITEL